MGFRDGRTEPMDFKDREHKVRFGLLYALRSAKTSG